MTGMSEKTKHSVHDIIKKYDLPVIRGNQPVREYLKGFYEDFIKDLQETMAQDYPSDLPPSFYNVLSSKIIPTIKIECDMILDILELDCRNQQSKKTEKFNKLMLFLIEHKAFKGLELKKGDLMARIRPSVGTYGRKDIFHIPFTQRKFASSQRFSIPGNPCLYLSVYRGLNIHNQEMIRAAWMECGMPKAFTSCKFELQKDFVFLHFGKSGCNYLSAYKYEKDENEKKKLRVSIAQYLLSFPMRVACHISIENKLSQGNIGYCEEYAFPQLLMEWIQENSAFDGVAYRSASMVSEAKTLYTYNVAIPVRNIDPKDGYDPYLKENFKLSSPQKIDLSSDLESESMVREIAAVKKYARKLEENLVMLNAGPLHPYNWLLSLCYSVCQIYSELKMGNISAFYQQLISLDDTLQIINNSIDNRKSANEWINLYDSCGTSEPLAGNDSEEILKPFQKEVVSTCRHMRGIFLLYNYVSHAENFEFI